jgi:hypothetical protein
LATLYRQRRRDWVRRLGTTSGYDVYRNGALLATTTGTGYSDATVAQGSSHQYAVAAFDAAGDVSAQSTPVTVNVGQNSQVDQFRRPQVGDSRRVGHLVGHWRGVGQPRCVLGRRFQRGRVCNVSGANGDTVNYTAAGSCGIDANQAGNANYAAASQVQATVAVTAHANQAPAITSAGSASATVGTAFSFTVTTAGYPATTLTLGGTLPTAVSFTANSVGTATFSGTPAKSGTYTEAITASNGVGTQATESLVITAR